MRDNGETNPPRGSKREQFETTFKKNGSDCKEAAVKLGWSVPTVYRKLKSYQLSHLLRRPRHLQ